MLDLQGTVPLFLWKSGGRLTFNSKLSGKPGEVKDNVIGLRVCGASQALISRLTDLLPPIQFNISAKCVFYMDLELST